MRAYEQSPGTNLIIGDSRLAHFDMDLVDSLTGQSWQNLAFGGASLKECVDLANYVLDSGNQVDRILFELSFYTLNSSYNTDRFFGAGSYPAQPAGLLSEPGIQRERPDRVYGHRKGHAGHH